MPAKTTQTGLLAKQGDKLVKAHEEHKDDEPSYGSPQVPGGIEGGVAQLTDLYIAPYKSDVQTVALRGQSYFYGQATIVHPKEHQGVPVLNMLTKIGPEALCDTPQAQGKRKTFSDHYGWMLNQLKILGFDAAQIKSNDKAVIEKGILAGMKALTTQMPYFKFRTWKGNKQQIEKKGNQYYFGKRGPYASEEALKKANPYWDRDPMVIHEWNGVCEWNGEAPAGAGVEDKTGGKDEVPDPSVPAPGGEVEPLALDELQGLAALADDKDEASIDKLTDIAREAGVDEDAMVKSGSWGEVVDLILVARGEEPQAPAEGGEAPTEGAGAEPEPEPEPEAKPVPKTKEAWNYRPPKTRSFVECIVTAVDGRAKSCSLKNLAKPAVVYKGVKFDDPNLQPAD